jgi:hypothetical protein
MGRNPVAVVILHMHGLWRLITDYEGWLNDDNHVDNVNNITFIIINGT